MIVKEKTGKGGWGRMRSSDREIALENMTYEKRENKVRTEA
jgi:hypothetical protein